jgi:hypothetical protein
VGNSTPVRLYAWIHFSPSQIRHLYNLTEFELFNRTKTNGIYDTIFPLPNINIRGGYIMFNPRWAPCCRSCPSSLNNFCHSIL